MLGSALHPATAGMQPLKGLRWDCRGWEQNNALSSARLRGQRRTWEHQVHDFIGMSD